MSRTESWRAYDIIDDDIKVEMNADINDDIDSKPYYEKPITKIDADEEVAGFGWNKGKSTRKLDSGNVVMMGCRVILRTVCHA